MTESSDLMYDILIIGGGITGAGIFHLASRAGLKTLLVDANDYSFGTSSRSSKLVHGGLRYLRNGQFGVTRESVREREWLLRAAPNLVTPLAFTLPHFAGSKTPHWQWGLGVFIYDLMAPKWQHRTLTRAETLAECPMVKQEGLEAAHRYMDAQVDDSRLVLRLIFEGVRAGGTARNYTRAESLLKTVDGTVCGAVLRTADGVTSEVQARVVINAAGPWADDLRQDVGANPRIRPLRGSHLVFPASRFPLSTAITLMHPRDNRAMFALPWEGAVVIGTTDIDETADWRSGEPTMSVEEGAYILEAARATFPAMELSEADVLSSFAGLRPIVSSGEGLDPSKESRAHVVWDEHGLITVTGGKLTIFRKMAAQALRMAASRIPGAPEFREDTPAFEPLPRQVDPHGLDNGQVAHLLGRHGTQTAAVLDAAEAGELESIPNQPNLWAELRWAARHEQVRHLDDLLLRRVRMGLLQPKGAADLLPKVRSIVQRELDWDDVRWQAEEKRYLKIWKQYYAGMSR